ncbi:hypothetical protein TNCV_3790031 [Trichonephila clavipes]|nr:hypothetical protein TNCV_3790031 [Trichonephila clavipes]
MYKGTLASNPRCSRHRRIDEADISTPVAVDHSAANCLEEAVRSTMRSRCRSSRVAGIDRHASQVSIVTRRRYRSSRVAATRGLLATDHVILNHGQVTWTTPELAPPSPNYHTTPTGGRFSSRQI